MSDLTPQSDDLQAAAQDLAEGMRRGMESGGDSMRKATASIERVDTLSRQNDLLSGVVAHLMHKYGVTTLIIGSFELEAGPRVSMRPDRVTSTDRDKHYYVELRHGRAGS